jgi:hypothetical protein
MRTSDDGGGGKTREELLKEIVEELNLEDPDSPQNKLGSDAVALRMHEEHSRVIVDWAILHRFLPAYLKRFPGALNLDLKEIEARKKIVLDQGNFYLTEAIIKHHYRELEPMGLGELAACRYPRNTSSWERFQRKLTGAEPPGIIDAAKDLQMWKAVPVGRQSKNGGGSIAKWEISAGQALLDFDEFVFQPLRWKQSEAVYTWFMSKRKEP